MPESINFNQSCPGLSSINN